MSRGRDVGVLTEMHRQNQAQRRAFLAVIDTATLEERIAELERHMAEQDRLLEALLGRLEAVLGDGLDQMPKTRARRPARRQAL